MRILVEPSDYKLINAGDMGMLHVAATRLGTLFPNATIQILSDTPDLLPEYCPNVKPLDTKGRRAWFTAGFLGGGLAAHLPTQAKTKIWELERFLRRRWPSLAEFILKAKLKRARNDDKSLRDFLEAVSNADLVIATGMGGITDAFPAYAYQLLDILRLAVQRGALTAMVGQGIGPIQDPKLRAQAKSVLRRIDFISLREKRAGGPLLHSLGVSSGRVLTTGDDAIEMAYERRSKILNSGLGINLRVAGYSRVDRGVVERVRAILQNVARKLQAPMVPVPISSHPEESDAVTIQQLMDGYDEISDCGKDLKTQFEVIKQIRRCRVVVAGSYHAAVFALAQGIPAIGLANSHYYEDKFLGLADQFGTGCQVIFLQENELSKKLSAAIETAWQSAEQGRTQLLAAAAKQVQLSHDAYQRIYELVNSRRK